MWVNMLQHQLYDSPLLEEIRMVLVRFVWNSEDGLGKGQGETLCFMEIGHQPIETSCGDHELLCVPPHGLSFALSMT